LKAKNLSFYKKKCDTLYSRVIRLRYAKKGIAKCVTCGKKDHYKKLQAGHYIPRNYLSLRFDDRNVHVQCVGCNMFKSGAMDEYARFMVKTYGSEILDELAVLKNKKVKFSIFDYQEMIDKYSDELIGLEMKNGCTS